MYKRVIAIVLFITGFFMVAFFGHYKGNLLPYPILSYFIGFAMWIIGFILYRNSKSFKETEAIDKLKFLVEELKSNGEKIVVDLDKCEVKENSFTEERDNWRNSNLISPVGNFNGDIQFWDGIYDVRRNIKKVDVTQSVLIFKNLNNGVEEKFISKIIPRSKEDLKFKFYLQKTTTLYVDKHNRGRYYFDLSFLNPEE